jgi:hypothetical protein
MVELGGNIFKQVVEQYERKVHDLDWKELEDLKKKAHEGPQVVDIETTEVMPLKAVSFDVKIAQGFADLTFTQLYENTTDSPLEILFKMPVSETLAVTSIEARFIKEGGEILLETEVIERQKARVQYQDVVSQGNTAVLANIEREDKRLQTSFFTVNLGNFPPHSFAVLKTFCT